MKTMDDVNLKYRELCVALGDVEVKLKGLSNQKAQIFEQLTELDQTASIIANQETETPEESK